MRHTFWFALAYMIAWSLQPPSARAEKVHCDADLATVGALASTTTLSAADAKIVKDALAKSEKLHAANQEEACERALAPARAILHVREQHFHE